MFSKKPIKILKLGSKYGFLYPRTVLIIGIIIFFAECFLIGYNIRAAATDADAKTTACITHAIDTSADTDTDKEGNEI